jgi:ketosteroid isomerase-like protein
LLSLQEISDRLEIQDLLARYSHAIDRRDWNALDGIFTPDAVIDYTAMGGAKGTLPDIKAYLKAALAYFIGFQHLVATSELTIDGDTAVAKTICHNPMIIDVDGVEWPFFCGLWYHDTLVRTPDGWRIQQRSEEKSYFFNVPPGFAPPPTQMEGNA